MTWTKCGRKVGPEGTTNTYALLGTTMTVESRKRHIPHANGVGTWDYTSYFVLDNGREIVEKQNLSVAKEFAERRWKDGNPSTDPR